MKPALLIDFDGVLAPYGEVDQLALSERGYHWHPKHRVWVNRYHGPMLWRFAEQHGFELVWCTLRDYEITEWIPSTYGFPENMPSVDFYGPDSTGTWKYQDVGRFAGPRPIAWLDDSFGVDPTEHMTFLQERMGPTKIVAIDPQVGLLPEHLDEVRQWWEMIR